MPSVLLNKISWRLIPYMFVLYVVAYLDRINISFAGLEMNKELGFADEVFGLGAGIFFVGYFLFGVPSNLVIQKIGARRWISLIMVVWGVISVAMALVKTQVAFYLLRFFLGVAEAGFFPGMILYLTYWFPRKEQGLAVARFMTAIPAAGVLGGLISSQILSLNALGLPGWKWLFIITGSPALLLGISVLFFLADKPQSATWLSQDEKNMLIAKIEEDNIDSESSKKLSLGQVFVNARVWHLAILYFCLTMGMYGFQLWLPQIIQNFDNTSPSQTALLSAIPAVFQAFGMILIARHSDKKSERRVHVAVSALIAAIGLIGSGLIQDPFFALVSLSITAFGLWGMVGPFWALPTSHLSREAAPCGIALINSFGNLGGFAGPYMIGLIKNNGNSFLGSLLTLSCFLFIAAFLALLLKADRQNSQKPC